MPDNWLLRETVKVAVEYLSAHLNLGEKIYIPQLKMTPVNS